MGTTPKSMEESDAEWQDTSQLDPRAYTCGHCGKAVRSVVGYYAAGDESFAIYICPSCECPTFFSTDHQVPIPESEEEIKYLPGNIAALYREVQNSYAVDAYTAAVLATRELIIHIALREGASKGQDFTAYVKYLENGWLPPNSERWVMPILVADDTTDGEMRLMTKSAADDLLALLKLLLL